MGRAELPDGGGEVRIIAGEYNGVQGPAQTFTPIHMFDIAFRASGRAQFALPSDFNTAALVLKGTATFNNDRMAQSGDFVLFDNMPGEIVIEGRTDDTLVIVLSGEPIHEPIFQHGPFVMNSKAEILEAFQDFQSGKMGNADF